jgi:4-amino-4-deoxy-L-arabinose transferase-like glycosyltransferase
MQTIKTAVPKIIIAVMFLAWIVPGIVGRDLWKADEPYSFGLVNNIVKTGDWVVPTLANEPFMEKPPLFYLTAAAFDRLFSGLLQSHDAARLASGFFMLLTVVFMGLTAREFQGKGYGAIAAIILMGCTGLQITAHKIITDVALLTGLSMALYGLALSRRRTVPGGLWLGIGTGIGFLSKGLLAPGMIGIIALALPVFSGWRKKSYLFTLLIAFFAALPWLLIWPYALYRRSPELFTQWFWYQNLGRFLGYSHVGRRFAPTFYLTNLPWFALPALPLGLWTLWANRRSWRSLPPAVHFPLTSFVIMFTILSLSSSIRDIYALPMLLPLSLLATAGVDSLEDRVRKSLNAFSIVFFGLVSLVLWLGWLVMMTGIPASAALKLQSLQPDYAPVFSAALFAAALAYTVTWMFAVRSFSRERYHPVMNWIAGITLTWALLMTIWLPWFDAGSGYRAIFTSLRQSLPAQHGVIASQGVGESERALLEYYAGIVTQRMEINKDVKDADLFLSESGEVPPDPPAGITWRLLWAKNRPSGDHPKEMFRLYQRIDGKISRK